MRALTGAALKQLAVRNKDIFTSDFKVWCALVVGVEEWRGG